MTLIQLEFPFMRDYTDEAGTFGTCRYCKRWSRLVAHNENTAGLLAGRCGIAYDCAYCGEEVSFMGKHY